MWPQIATVLTGDDVTLEPLRAERADGLREAAADERIWTFMVTTDVERWLEDAYAEHQAGTRVQFVVLRDGSVVGSTSYMSLAPEHRRLEIGNTWMNPSTWGTGANTEAKFLLLRHAFETLGCRRVEFKTDARNDRARAALAALPAEFEGIHRKHMVVRGEERRDSAWYAVIDDEWPGVKRAFRAASRADVAAFSGALRWPFIVVSVLALVPFVVLFGRWDVRAVLRRPPVQADASEDAPLPGETYVFTSTYARVLAAAFPLVLALTGIGVAVAAPSPAWLLVLPIAVLFGLVISRATRIVLELGYDAVTIRNTYRTHVLGWDEVGQAYLGADCLSFVVRGRRLAVEAVATRGRQRDGTLVHELRRFAEPRGIELEAELLRI